MSRTYKHMPTEVVRRPKGRKQALINEARKKAIPPDAWDDLHFDNHCYAVYNAAENMLEQGKSKSEIISKIRKKFNLTFYEASSVYASITKFSY